MDYLFSAQLYKSNKNNSRLQKKKITDVLKYVMQNIVQAIAAFDLLHLIY